MHAAYVYHEALTFSDYTDLGTGKTLRAEPGGTYDIAPASGHVVPEIPEPWFVPAGEDAYLAEPLPGEAQDGAEAVPAAGAGQEDGRGSAEG